MGKRLKDTARERGETLDTLIPRLLNELGTMEAVAQELGVSFITIYRWCDQHGIQRRVVYEIGEARRVS